MADSPTRNRARDLLAKPENGAPKTDAELLELDRVKARAREAKAEAKRIVRALEKELGEYQDRLGFLDKLSDAPDPKPYKVRRKGRKKGKLPQASYVMLASDWHMGENVRPETCQWRNEYNPDIARTRAEKYWKSNLTMLNAARSAWDIRQGVLWLGGDLMTGYIHEEYEEDNFLSPVEEALLVYETMNHGIERLLAESDLEHILIPTNHGNHGRTGKKMRIGTSAKNSYEWMLYQFLARRWEEEDRVTFQISAGYHNLVDLYGFRIRFHHGDQIGYGGGIGGLSIPVNKRIGRQAKGDPEKVHLDAIGHFHSLQHPKDFIVNGSLIGWNAFAESKGFGFEAPMQASFVVDERHPIVSNFNPILVT